MPENIEYPVEQLSEVFQIKKTEIVDVVVVI
jgi:hypothetical protein